MAGRIVEVEVGQEVQAAGQGADVHLPLSVLGHPRGIPVREKEIEGIVGGGVFCGEARQCDLGRRFFREANAEFSPRT